MLLVFPEKFLFRANGPNFSLELWLCPNIFLKNLAVWKVPRGTLKVCWFFLWKSVILGISAFLAQFGPKNVASHYLWIHSNYFFQNVCVIMSFYKVRKSSWFLIGIHLISFAVDFWFLNLCCGYHFLLFCPLTCFSQKHSIR